MSWGSAIEVPGTATLNTGGDARLDTISCAGAGACAAGGDYLDGSGFHAFVVDEANGAWGTAIEVPGMATLSHKGYGTGVSQISCAKPGFCAAGGNYRDARGHIQAFVVDETNSVWGTAIEVPGTAKLNVRGSAAVDAISCAKPGFCVAGGYFNDHDGNGQAFLVTEKNGVWRKAIVVPGMTTPRHGNQEVNSISCPTAGNCTAGGTFSPKCCVAKPFVVNEKNGVWGKAIEVPGTAKLNAGANAMIEAISCPSAHTCSAGGYYSDSHASRHAFVVNKTRGVWRKAIEVPGLGALNRGGSARVSVLSCAARGSCAAGGYYLDRTEHLRAFVANETRGVWRKARAVPGLGEQSDVGAISCGAAGSCAAGGYYDDGSGTHAFVLGESGGVWAKATDVPGSEALNVSGGAEVDSISCVATGACVVGGGYLDDSGDSQVFVTSP